MAYSYQPIIKESYTLVPPQAINLPPASSPDTPSEHTININFTTPGAGILYIMTDMPSLGKVVVTLNGNPITFDVIPFNKYMLLIPANTTINSITLQSYNQFSETVHIYALILDPGKLFIWNLINSEFAARRFVVI